MSIEGASALGLWVLIAIVLIPAVDTVSKWFRKETPKREVSLLDAWATKKEIHEVKEDVSKFKGKVDKELTSIKEEMKRDREAILKAGEDRAVAIHNRINPLCERMGAVESSTNHIAQRTVLMDAKLDNLIGRRA